MFEIVLLNLSHKSFMYTRHILRRRKIGKTGNYASFGEKMRIAVSFELSAAGLDFHWKCKYIFSQLMAES